MYKPLSDCQIPRLDEIYLKNFGYKTDGAFVEIGAYDGHSISNTSFLADIGWKGIYVEPVKEYYEKCSNRHSNNNVKVYNNLVGDSEDIKTIFKGGDLSTSKKEMVNFFQTGPLGWARSAHDGASEQVLQTTLTSIFETNKLKNIDLLVIDTEGSEWDIIKDFDFNKFLIKMIIIEMHETSDAWKSCPNLIHDNYNINNILESYGYNKIFVDDINTIFVR